MLICLCIKNFIACQSFVVEFYTPLTFFLIKYGFIELKINLEF